MQNADMNGVGFALGMLWVFMLMASMLAAYIGRRTNEQKARTVGYELEVIKTAHAHSRDANHSLARFLTKVKSRGGFDAYFAGYTHDVVNNTKIVTDGSLSEGGIELVSPPLHGLKKRRQWLSDTCGALLGLVRVNRTCGVHVHIGLKSPAESWGYDGVMRWSTAKQIAAKTAVLYTLFQGAFNSVVPPSRRNNSYARTMHWAPASILTALERDRRDEEDAWTNLYHTMIEESRYYCVNVQSLRKYGTIEFRQHAGSVNPTKLDAWTQLLGVLVARAESITHDEVKALLAAWNSRTSEWDLSDLGHFLGLSQRTNLMRYFNKRADQLKGLSIEPCTNCGSPNCAGCPDANPTVYDWGEIHDDNDYYMSLQGLGLLVFALTQPLAVAALAIIGCGIGALHSRGKEYHNNKTGAALWSNLAQRGNQAAGVGWVDAESVADGTHSFFYHKAPHSSNEQVGILKRLLNKTVRYAMFHTRFATHGANNADNAHPHFSSDNQVMLVHNGVVGNSDAVWRALGREPTGPVDSQAIAECLAVGGINEVIKHCVGTMSLIWADARDPAGTLHFWTNGGNPLHFGRLDNLSGDIMIASTKALWVASAGKRAMTTEVRKVKTKQVKIGKGFSLRYQTQQVKDKKGRLVYHTVYEPSHNWACTIGKHYTISPEGEVSGYMTENHGKTIRTGGSYDWRSYGASSWNKTTPLKAEGDADNCALPDDKKPNVTLDDLDMIYDIMDKHGGWPPFKGTSGEMLHGYDGRTHQGITPKQVRYNLHSNYTQPWLYEADRMDLLAGEYYEAEEDLYAQLWNDADPWMF